VSERVGCIWIWERWGNSPHSQEYSSDVAEFCDRGSEERDGGSGGKAEDGHRLGNGIGSWGGDAGRNAMVSDMLGDVSDAEMAVVCGKLNEADDFENSPDGEVEGALRSRKSGSWPIPSSMKSPFRSLAPNPPKSGSSSGSGETGSVGSSSGEVIRSSGTSSSVPKTKKASPASPIFMLNGTDFPLTVMST